MKISRIAITNILGTATADFKPGTMTVVEGQNGSGKSSILEAIKSVFAGGHDPGLLRKGNKSGEVIIELDTGTSIRKKITEKSSTLEITDEEGHKVPAPMSFMNELGEMLAVDPSRLLNADSKQLVAVLQEVLPIRFRSNEVRKAVGEVVKEEMADSLDIDALEALRDNLYQRRTRVNAVAKDAEGTRNELRKALPDGDDKDWSAEVGRLEAEAADLHAAMRAEYEAIDENLQKQLDEINAEALRKSVAAREWATNAKGAVQEQAKQYQDGITGELAVARQHHANRERVEAIKKQIADANKKASENNALSSNITLAMERLDALKKQKMEECPIPGLNPAKGTYNDIPWAHLNLAKRVELAFQVCALRSGKLSFLIADNLEALDNDNWEAVKEGAQASGYQIIAARVGEGPLKISRQ